MKSQFLKTMVVTLLVLGVFVGNTLAKKTPKANESSKPEYKNYEGTVEVTKDKAGDITAVKLMVSDKLSYSITLDAKGKELGQKMEGKKVNVKGMLSEKADEKWLTITEYSAAHSKSKKETQKK